MLVQSCLLGKAVRHVWSNQVGVIAAVAFSPVGPEWRILVQVGLELEEWDYSVVTLEPTEGVNDNGR